MASQVQLQWVGQAARDPGMALVRLDLGPPDFGLPGLGHCSRRRRSSFHLGMSLRLPERVRVLAQAFLRHVSSWKVSNQARPVLKE